MAESVQEPAGPKAGRAGSSRGDPRPAQQTTSHHAASKAASASAEAPAALTDAKPAPAAPRSNPAPKLARPERIIRQVELVDLVRAYYPAVNEDLLNRAYVFAMKAHGDQTRKSGDPYFTHPLAVAQILTGLRADEASVATALLHDVVEDTNATIEDIERLFGSEIARLVAGVTKLSQIQIAEIVGDPKAGASKHQTQFEQFRKFVVAMADDLRVLLVKLADRLHNMRTLHHFDNVAKRERIALETMEIYAPLAGRIGVHAFREELENLAFAEINPHAFRTISDKLERRAADTAATVGELAAEIEERLRSNGIVAEVHSREKKPYSIWRKMAVKRVTFERIADVYGFRVLVRSVEDCYRALGVIHAGWRMEKDEFDDYISLPKPNGYRSIHTVVFVPPRAGGSHHRIEVQIRTRDMHELAERGAAAHWQYKDPAAARAAGGIFDPYETPRRLLETLQQGDNPEEAMRYAKMELFQDQVFCFTPKGEVFALPRGATSLDFAYAVHSDIGDQFIGAKINGVWMPPRTPLKNSDVVEVHTSEGAPVPAGWESIAVTGRARTAIRRRIKKMRFEEKVRLGREKAEAVFAGAKLEFSTKAVREAVRRLIGEKGRIEDVLVKIADGEISVQQVIDAAYPGAAPEATGEFRPAARSAFNPHAAIDGLPPGVPIKMGACCSPVPGERLVGVWQEDGSIAVHAIDCAAWARLDPPETDILDIGWRRDGPEAFAFTGVLVTVRNEIGVLSEVAAVIARYGVSISNISMRNHSADFVDMFIEVEVKSDRQIAQLLAGLRAVSTVVSAERCEARPDE